MRERERERESALNNDKCTVHCRRLKIIHLASLFQTAKGFFFNEDFLQSIHTSNLGNNGK